MVHIRIHARMGRKWSLAGCQDTRHKSYYSQGFQAAEVFRIHRILTQIRDYSTRDSPPPNEYFASFESLPFAGIPRFPSSGPLSHPEAYSAGTCYDSLL